LTYIAAVFEKTREPTQKKTLKVMFFGF